jgi:hypothetical protein
VSNFNRTNNINVAVVGIVKDIETTIGEDYSKLNESLSFFNKVKWFLVESDSQDATVRLLNEIRKSDPNFNFVSLGKLQTGTAQRTVGMAAARNRYLHEIRENSEYEDVDFIVIADFNGLNNLINKDSVASCFVRSDWDACFANQSKKYYDIWALRHPLWSPNDCWSQHSFFRKYSKVPELALYSSVQARMIHLPSDSDWIEVDSAFGGFAIYRKTALKHGSYFGETEEGVACCEHVPFNLALRKKGYKLFINPKLINADSTDHSENAFLGKFLLRLFKYPRKFIKAKYSSKLP